MAGPAPGAGRRSWSPRPRSEGCAAMAEVADTRHRGGDPSAGAPAGRRDPRRGGRGAGQRADHRRAPSSPRSPWTSRPRTAGPPTGPATRCDRRVRLLIVPGPRSLGDRGRGRPARRRGGRSGPSATDVRPALLFDDSYRATIALRDDPDWQKAMRRRGITDFDKVQIDPWPTGNFGNPLEEGRRIARCLSYYREEPVRQRLRPTGRGRAGHGGRRPGRGPRGPRLRGGPHAPRTAAATGPRTTSPCAPDLGPWTSSSPRGSASPSTPTS